jgi:hypothetical protein
LTEVYNKKEYDLKVYPPEVFYPFNQYNIKNFDKNNPPEGALAVHMWNYSWGSPVIKLTKKLGLHRLLVTLAGKIGIKKALKGLLKSE